MAYGLNSEVLILKEGFIDIGTYANFATISPSNALTTHFTSDGNVGYFKQGSSKIEINRKYADFIAGTPGKHIRMDLVLKEFLMTFSFAQFDADRLALAQGLDVETGLYDLAWIGSDEPGGTVTPTGFNGYLLYTALVDAQPFYVAGWYMKNVSEAVGWTLSGTEHGTYDIKLMAFEAPYYQQNPDDTHNYGAIQFTNVSST